MIFFLDLLGWFLLGIGTLVLLTGAIGLIRLPDFFTRMHAAGLIDTLGASFVLAGLMIEAGWSLNLPKLLMILVFLLFTSPTSSHALVHAALARGLKPWKRNDNDGQSEKTGGNDPSNR